MAADERVEVLPTRRGFLGHMSCPTTLPLEDKDSSLHQQAQLPFGQRPGDTEESSVVSILERGRRAKKSRGPRPTILQKHAGIWPWTS